MAYCINLKKISINDFYKKLKNQRLLPSRMLLKENIDLNFQKIEEEGIKDLYALKEILINPKKSAFFGQKYKIPEEYLILLKREISALETKVLPIKEVINDDSIVKKLNEMGIKTSKDFFETKLSNDYSELGLSYEELIRYKAYADLIRINGFRTVAARMFYDAGFISAEDVAAANSEEMARK